MFQLQVLPLLVLSFPVFVSAAQTVLAAAPPEVTLRQGVFTGVAFANPGYKWHVQAFMGIPYAQPPVNNLRLREPLPVENSTEKFDATRFGVECPQASLIPARGPDTPGMSEDCLTINVFLPQIQGGITPKDIPVGVNIHGGAFNLGAAKALNVSTMVSWSDEHFVGVSFNYRLGAMGFLPSTLSAKEGALNLGLKDQRLALRWVKENIGAFGGNPDQVTIFGPSAGAHSIGHHLLNLEEGEEQLFHRVIMEDGAPTARKVPDYNDTLVEQQFEEFRVAANCGHVTNPDNIFHCLRAITANDFIGASLRIFNQYTASVNWPFQPVVDGDIIAERPTEQWETGHWNKVPIMTGFSTDEGTQFVNPFMNTSEAFTSFFTNLIPLFNSTDIQLLNSLYPDPLKNSSSPYLETRPGLGSQFKRVAAAYGHYAYVCNIFTTAEYATEEKVPMWLWHWDTNVSYVLGASHTSHTPYESYELDIRAISPTQDELASVLTAYMTSFITKGDPNVVHGYLGKARPRWTQYGSVPTMGAVMRLGEGNDERAGGRNLGIVAAMRNNDQFRDECEFWNSRSEKLDH